MAWAAVITTEDAADATPAAVLTTAAVGTATDYAREDHAHTIAVSAPITFTGNTLDLDETAALGNNARVAVIKNSGAVVGTRRAINFIEGTNVTLTVADDSANEEVEVTITASGGASNSFVTIDCPAGTDPVADTSTDTLTLTNGTGIAITGTAASDSIAFAISGDLRVGAAEGAELELIGLRPKGYITASLPAAPAAGTIAYDTTTTQLKVWIA